MSSYNIFLASPKGTSDQEVESALELVQSKFSEAIPHATVTVVKAKDEFDRTFKQCGGWDGWTTHVATGVDYEFRTPLYNAIVCTTPTVGRATAQIAERALAARRMVALVQQGTLSRVVGVECLDSDNWQTGWRLNTAP
jgi:hypothetical protein